MQIHRMRSIAHTEHRVRAATVVLTTVAAAACFGLALFGLAPSAAHAESSPTPPPSTTYSPSDTDFSLTISPTRLVIGPDATADVQSIAVINRGEKSVHVVVQKRSFEAAADGSLTFTESAAYSASTWVTVTPASFDLAPGASTAVTATVAVPADPEIGDHQVAIVFLVPSAATSGNITINRGVATPVYITVPGVADDSASVAKLSAPGFSSGGAVSVSATVRSTGTVHRDFRGDSALKLTGTDDAFPDFTVVRGATRNITTTWNPPLLCFCTLAVSVVNDDGTTTRDSVTVFVFPVLLACIIAGALLLLIVLTVVARTYGRRLRRVGAGAHSAHGRGDA